MGKRKKRVDPMAVLLEFRVKDGWLCVKDFQGYWHRCVALTPEQVWEIRKLTKDGKFRLS
jgi:hypothetical protein